MASPISKYLATLAKSGNERIAMKAAKANRLRVAEWCNKYPGFAAKRDAALKRGKAAQASRVPGRRKGRPPLALTSAQRAELLALYAESGNADLAALHVGVSLAYVIKLRKRDSVFAAAWLDARNRSAALASIAEPWPKREARLLMALAQGAPVADAALAAGISEHLARLIAGRATLPRPPMTGNRFDRTPKRHASHVRAAPQVRREATAAELQAIAASDAMRKAAERMTPEQRAFIALRRDDGLSLAEACARAKLSPRQVQLWADSNIYFAQAISD